MWGQFLICSFKTENCQSWPWLGLSKNHPHIHYWETKTIVERAFQILILMNFHEPLKIKCNFQWPSSSDSPLPVAEILIYGYSLILVFLYCSCICSMNVTVRRSEADADEEFHFVIKSPPKSSFIRMMHKFSRPFFNEVTWYEDLIPMLEVVNGKNCIERMLPKCYFAYSNYYMQVQVIYFLTFPACF